MKIYDIKQIHYWFDNYVGSFAIDGKLPFISEIKRAHSFKVEDVGRRLVTEMNWDDDPALLGAAASLLHDIGRFSQFRDYNTLYDSSSVDHGERGYEELRSFFPKELADEEGYEAIAESVRWHNKKELPYDIKDLYVPFCKLVRDADKIDVFRLVQDHLARGKIDELLPKHKISAALSEPFLEEIEEHGYSSYKNVSSLADFLLMQITWLLDINYAASMKMISELGIVEKIIKQLPLNKRASDVLDSLLKKIEVYKLSLI
jgi:HD superfamily phosphodiesterase